MRASARGIRYLQGAMPAAQGFLSFRMRRTRVYVSAVAGAAGRERMLRPQCKAAGWTFLGVYGIASDTPIRNLNCTR